MRVLSVIAILIAYGSLYPGDFATPGAGATKEFLTDWRLFTSRGDLLGNLALFFPLGIVGILFASPSPSVTIRVAWLLLLALAFSFVLQLAQVWLPSRSPALADVMWNMAGMMLGMATAHLIGKRTSGRVRAFDSASLAAQSILVLWLLTELLPLVPTLDWQKFKDALKPLFLDYTLSFPTAMMHATGVIIAGSAFVALRQRPGWWLLGAVVLVMAGKLAIVNLTLNASILTGVLTGYIGFLVMLPLGNTKIFASAFWLLFAAWSITAIMPFSPVSGGAFNGIPFQTMLQGSMETGVRGLVQSLFIYTALLWLAQKTGMGIGNAMVGLTIWTCLIELVQMGLLGRTADVTEPILLLLVGWVLSVTQSFGAADRREVGTSASQRQPAPLRSTQR
ncbi:VanZ like family protein [Nitrosospira sp. Nl5]|uniref:VanZ family protein n=1 Tax=Nitrosospira sp. Nl5 TaxID=200120 RepID=UPI00088102A4|nr:VanZ family protein [Nitrosospira sp. Nl5]SCY17669.1 VanZ like family protein [Nitrosospira sp. Nl5]